MKVDIQKITPTLSKDWLEQNANFREPIQAHIDSMAKDMKAGKWDENGESIKFDTKDRLVDGQNRLMACIAADTPFTSVVVYGVKSDLNIDIGSKRALKQWLAHNGVESYACDIAASLRSLSCLLGGKWNSSGKTGSTKPTHHNLVKLLRDKPAIKDAVSRVQRTKEFIPCSAMAPLYFIFSEKDKALADKFIDALENKLELPNTDPAMILRDRLIQNRSAKTKLSKRAVMAMTIIAWNHWRNGTTCKCLKFAESGPSKQDFPEIV